MREETAGGEQRRKAWPCTGSLMWAQEVRSSLLRGEVGVFKTWRYSDSLMRGQGVCFTVLTPRQAGVGGLLKAMIHFSNVIELL